MPQRPGAPRRAPGPAHRPALGMAGPGPSHAPHPYTSPARGTARGTAAGAARLTRAAPAPPLTQAFPAGGPRPARAGGRQRPLTFCTPRAGRGALQIRDPRPRPFGRARLRWPALLCVCADSRLWVGPRCTAAYGRGGPGVSSSLARGNGWPRPGLGPRRAAGRSSVGWGWPRPAGPALPRIAGNTSHHKPSYPSPLRSAFARKPLAARHGMARAAHTAGPLPVPKPLYNTLCNTTTDKMHPCICLAAVSRAVRCGPHSFRAETAETLITQGSKQGSRHRLHRARSARSQAAAGGARKRPQTA